MDISLATQRLSALAQERRLGVFRLLVRAGDPGLPAGAIAASLDVPHNTLSSHLGILEQAGLVRSRRDGRRVIYRVDFDGMRGLLAYLLEECCQGAPEACESALDAVLPGGCAAANPGVHTQ